VYVHGETLDDLLRRVLRKLLTAKTRINPTRGAGVELMGVVLELADPRARLSRTERKGHVFSCLGELCWYLAKTNDVEFIAYYVERYRQEAEGSVIYGGYGPRLFAMRGVDQVRNVIDLLKRKPDSRRAVVQLFNAEDIAADHKDVPCTCTLQFMMRDSRLHMFTSMRSNDAYLGLPHDVFAFTMVQEIVARSLNTEVGIYKHAVGSLHLYDVHRANARQYFREGWQPRLSMPPMPPGDPWPALNVLVAAERDLREGRGVDIDRLGIAPYWQDLMRLIQVFRYARHGQVTDIDNVRQRMSVPDYDQYIDDRRELAERRATSHNGAQ
jgi:thymidylate synthase